VLAVVAIAIAIWFVPRIEDRVLQSILLVYALHDQVPGYRRAREPDQVCGREDRSRPCGAGLAVGGSATSERYVDVHGVQHGPRPELPVRST